MTDSIRVFELKGLEEDFDDDLAKSILEIHIDKTLHPQEAVEKSLYNFDLETPEGIDRLLELLPILDPDILNEIYQEIFPGYPVDMLAPRMARVELRGYLMDYLEDSGRQEAGREEAAVREAEAEAAGAGSAATVSQPAEPGPETLEGAGPEGIPAKPEPGAKADNPEAPGVGAAPN